MTGLKNKEVASGKVNEINTAKNGNNVVAGTIGHFTGESVEEMVKHQ